MQRASEDIDSYCGKCRLELAHVVIAAEHGKAIRVQCKTCGSPHNHRAKKPRAPAAAKAPRRATTKGARGAAAGAASFEQAMAGHDLTRAVRYKPQVTLDSNQVIDHPKFGFGLVVRLLSDAKVVILFSDAERILVHNRS